MNKQSIILIMTLLIITSVLIDGKLTSEQNSEKPNVHNLVTDEVPDTISIVDFTGQTVQLKKPAQRIVALAPHLVENAFSAGAGNQLVGTVEFSNYPEQALSIPKVGGYTKINLESIVALQPDLVIGWSSGNQNKIFQKIRDLNIPLYIDNPKSLKDVARVITDIGSLSGHKDHSKKVAQDFLNNIENLRTTYNNAKPIDVFYQVWNDPLHTINGTQIISHVIELCGGRNIYADAPVISPVISLESLIDRDPKVIIASGMDEQRPEWLTDWEKWPHLTAVQEKNLYFVPPDIIQRHTVRIFDGAKIICQQLQRARNK